MRNMTRFLPLLLLLGMVATAPATAQDPVPAARAPIGTNLARIDDWSREIPFADVFKTSRDWISGTAQTWDDGRPLDRDEHGWVRSLLPGQIARTLMFTGAGNRFPGGHYLVTWEGQGTLRYRGSATCYESAPGRDVIDVDPARGQILLEILSVNPVDYLRNLHVFLPGAQPGELFNPVFLQRIASYRALRFMDWMAVNGNWNRIDGCWQRRWADRPRVDDARWSGTHGVPLEILCDLANRLGADPWFCIPHLADDDYVRGFAETVRDHLDPRLRAHVEYSNEVWNTSYAQSVYARQQGLALGLSADPFLAQMLFHALRSRQIFGICEPVLPPARLARVLGAWAANGWSSVQMLNFRDVAQHVDAIAIAPYFGYSPGEEARARTLTLDQMMGELETIIMPRALADAQRYVRAVAPYGVPVIAYEAGQSLVGVAYREDAALNALYDAANRDPRMGRIYSAYLQGWHDLTGGALLMHFLNCGPFNKWGRWGSLEFQDQPREQAPKYDALQRYIEEYPAQ